jgi:hypothetical protein
MGFPFVMVASWQIADFVDYTEEIQREPGAVMAFGTGIGLGFKA